MASVDPIRAHLRILSVCWAAYGLFCLAVGALMYMYSDAALFMAWPIANRMGSPMELIAIFHGAYLVVIGLSCICGVLGLLAGVTLHRRSALGRKLALLAGFLSLSRIPLGITLGVYTLVVLLPADSVRSLVQGDG